MEGVDGCEANHELCHINPALCNRTAEGIDDKLEVSNPLNFGFDEFVRC
jgi:hypothetical protein